MKKTKSKYILTIAIPTFNRCEYLKLLLQSLIHQGHPAVEIWVCDNASTDRTKTLVSVLNSPIMPLFYNTNGINIGASRNIAYASSVGSGEYIWVLGDDEIVPDGALGKIIAYLETGIDYLMINHAVFDSEMHQVKISRWNKIRADIRMCGKSQAMRVLGPSPSFISCIIARRGILDCLSSEQVSRYGDLGFNQIYAFYSSLTEKTVGIATAENLVHARGNNSGATYDWNKYFVVGLAIIFKDLGFNNGYSNCDINKTLGSIITRYHIKRLLNEKAEGRISSELRRLAYAYYSNQWLFWTVLIPVSLIPSFLMRPVKKLKKYVQGIKK